MPKQTNGKNNASSCQEVPLRVGQHTRGRNHHSPRQRRCDRDRHPYIAGEELRHREVRKAIRGHTGSKGRSQPDPGNLVAEPMSTTTLRARKGRTLLGKTKKDETHPPPSAVPKAPPRPPQPLPITAEDTVLDLFPGSCFQCGLQSMVFRLLWSGAHLGGKDHGLICLNCSSSGFYQSPFRLGGKH